MLGRVLQVAVVAGALIGGLILTGFLAEPSGPAYWTRESLLRWLGLGVAAVIVEVVVETVVGRFRRRKRYPELEFVPQRKRRR